MEGKKNTLAQGGLTCKSVLTLGDPRFRHQANREIGMFTTTLAAARCTPRELD
jgi:hypothetical protein